MRDHVTGATARSFKGRIPWAKSTSLPIDLGESVPHLEAHYYCARKHVFTVPLAQSVKPPPHWRCRAHGVEGHLDGGAPLIEESGNPRSCAPGKTHLQHILERRSVSELEGLLEERLAVLRQGRVSTTSADCLRHPDDVRYEHR